MWPNLKLSLWRRDSTPVNDPSSQAVMRVSPVEKAPPSGFSALKPRQIAGHDGGVRYVAFLPDGKQVLSGGNDGTVGRMNLEDGNLKRSNDEERQISLEGAQRAVTFSMDGKWTILAKAQAGGRKVTVYDTVTHQRVVESADQHEQKITALDVSPDSTKIASGSLDGAVIIWCMDSGRRLAGPFKQGLAVFSVKFSPTGECLASAGWDFDIRIWDFTCHGHGNDIDNFKFKRRMIPAEPVYALAWSNDGRRLFTGSSRGSIMCFDVAKECLLYRWELAHVDALSALCVSNNGKFLISASDSERKIKVWDPQTQSSISFPLEHTGEVTTLAISPDDNHLVSGGTDGQISLWNLRKIVPPAYFFYPFPALLGPQSLNGPQPILTQLSNAVYQAWKVSDLKKAEDLLSSEIERGGWSQEHVAYGNRALFRVRLKDWDGALKDAQASIDLKPSLAAFIAKSFALCGQPEANPDLAITTLDCALDTCEPSERDFVTLVKSILLFELGRREEGEVCIRELILSLSVPSAKQTCALVQAKMLVFRAEDAMRRQDYIETSKLVTRIQNLGSLSMVPEISTISLITGWIFDDMKFSILQKWAEACYAAGRTQEAISSLSPIESELKGNVKPTKANIDWLSDIKSRCIHRLESQGDSAMLDKTWDIATARYSEALGIKPPPPLSGSLFLKRSKARLEMHLWEGALEDANEVTRLDPSSHTGYECKHAALHGLERYEEAVVAFETMLSKLDNSSDSDTRRLLDQYVRPSLTKKAILKAFKDVVHNSPLRLIDTKTGEICDPEQRKKILEKDSIWNELISSMTTQLDKQRIRTAIGNHSRYVMLSHRWMGREPELADIKDRSVYHLDPPGSPPVTKLQRFCQIARDAGFRWAWSDTCCINKSHQVEVAHAINSMFRWYRSSSLTLVYLSGVHRSSHGSLKESSWMTRGWTLQELLAPPVIRFYYADWTPYLNDTSYNHKDSDIIMQELAQATDVSVELLRTFRPGSENIRLKLRLASKRETTIPVDVAYCLSGIFDIVMPIIYGESQQHALGRLLQIIVDRWGDVSCLSWTGTSSFEFNTAIPATIDVYANSPLTTTLVGEVEMENWISSRLTRTMSSGEEDQLMAFYRRVANLGAARFASRRLYLPCIVFPLTSLRRESRLDGLRTYSASATALRDTVIRTAEKLPPYEDLCLACPWIHELLASEIVYARQTGEPESYVDTDSESDLDVDVDVSEAALNRRLLDFALDDEAPLPVPPPRRHRTTTLTHFDDRTKALRFFARFSKPMGAFLMRAKGWGVYERVGADCEIVIRVQEGVSFDAIDVQTLAIL